jgi:hypothetical protein
MLDLETVKNAKHAHQATVSDAGHNGLSVVDQVYVAVSAGVAGALGYFFVRIVALGLVVAPRFPLSHVGLRKRKRCKQMARRKTRRLNQSFFCSSDIANAAPIGLPV